MTVIDRISFRFGMADEQFARELYADWDGFCRRCVTDILEEFFDRYDTKDTYIEMDRLDLELGSIPQEEFHEVFPVRLREALERSFVQRLNETGRSRLESSENTDEGTAPVPDKSSPYAKEKRFGNLLHYLEYGFCLPEWDAREFDLYAELLQFRDMAYTERLLPLLASKPYVLERLFLQTDAERLAEAIPFTAWLSSSALGRCEKQRYLSAVLEHSPQALIRFIHGAEDAGSVEGMAELLENPHVRHIMAAETENHAEIDVPEYWYRLYGWLLEYYPFNGVPMFGDKRHFRLHLNRRLLTFIRKRDYQAYLSKADLTIQFLLEVFGADYYMTVLGIIYRNQPLNEDGSPATGDGYAWELYYMLLQLSLLGTRENAAENTEKQPTEGGAQDASAPHTGASALLAGHAGLFERWLENPEQPEHVKRESLLRLAKERPELLIRWLKTRPERKYLSLLAELIDGPALLSFAGSVSLQLAETVSVVSDALEKSSVSVSWLRNIGKDSLSMALRTAVWQGIVMGIFPASDSAMVRLLRIAGLLYQELTGHEVVPAVGISSAIDVVVGTDKPGLADNPAIPEPLRELMEYIATDFPSLHTIEERADAEGSYNGHRPDKPIPAIERFASLKAVLSDNRIPDMAKRLLILQRLDACQGEECEFVWSLQEEKLLDAVISLLDTATLRHIAVRLAIQNYGTGGMESGISIAPFVGLLAEHIEEIASVVSQPAKTVWRALFVSLASWNGSMTSGLVNGCMDGVIRLLSDIAGSDKVQTVIESLIGKLLHIPYITASGNETIHHDTDVAGFLPGFENKALLSQLVRLQQYIVAQKTASELFVTDAGKDGRTGTAIHRDSADKKSDALDDRKTLNKVQTTFEHCLNDTEELIRWLHNGSFSIAQKREAFLSYMADSPDKAIRLIQETIGSDESSAALWSEIIGKDNMLRLVGQADSALSGVLAQTIGIATAALAESGLFAGGSAERDMYITRAMLLLLAKRPEPDKMDVGKTASLFLRSLHYVLTGNKEYTATDRERWQKTEKEAMNILAHATTAASTVSGTASDSEDYGMKLPPSDDWETGQGGKIFDRWAAWLLSPSVSDTEKSQMLRYHARWQPKLLWEFVRYSGVDSPCKSNIPFSRWNTWMDTETWLEMIAGVSFSLAEILSRTTATLSEKYGIAGFVLSEGLVRFVAGYPADRIHYGNDSSIVSEYTEILVVSVWKGEVPDVVRKQSAAIADNGQPGPEKADTTLQPEQLQPVWESIARDVEAELHITDTGQVLEDAVQPEYIEVPNAGLCLLAIWFPRLFDMLGLLVANADGKKDFKDIETRIRAVFILQRLVTDEVREYEEHELAFNRILTGCPFHVPLPKTLEQTQNEIQTAESMLAGVKANWDKLKNTSIKGFQRSFIERPGRLEQRKDKWVLYVENRGYDILLDSLPWSYRTIRLPWLRKKINVVWRDKEEFDFENF